MAETKIDPDPNPWPCGVYILVDVVHFSEVVIDQWVRYWNSLNLSLVKFIGEVNTSFRHAVTIKWDYVQSGWDLVLGLGVQVEVVCFFFREILGLFLVTASETCGCLFEFSGWDFQCPLTHDIYFATWIKDMNLMSLYFVLGTQWPAQCNLPFPSLAI